MGQISTSETPALSGIKVLDRSVLILKSVAETPRTLAELCEDTGLPRATAHPVSYTQLRAQETETRNADAIY